jgi:hypothetical protein
MITEGEFKAAVFWRYAGLGSQCGRKPMGALAMPGIYFVNHWDVMEQIYAWLHQVWCRRVVVVYDNEVRTGSINNITVVSVRARALCQKIAKRLRIAAETAVLPDAWRNEKGKADWDGAAAALLQPKAV